MSERKEKWGDAPRRELAEPKTGQRAGTPPGLIRRPPKVPPMQRIKK